MKKIVVMFFLAVMPTFAQRVVKLEDMANINECSGFTFYLGNEAGSYGLIEWHADTTAVFKFMQDLGYEKKPSEDNFLVYFKKDFREEAIGFDNKGRFIWGSAKYNFDKDELNKMFNRWEGILRDYRNYFGKEFKIQPARESYGFTYSNRYYFKKKCKKKGTIEISVNYTVSDDSGNSWISVSYDLKK